jgi:predicted lipoprotein with Yx(FWY)xxD motif
MRKSAGLIAIPLLALTLAGCSGHADGDKAADKKAGQQPPANVTVKVAQTSLGPILTDEANRTLYAFKKDKNGSSSCADDCIATWPALTTSNKITAGEGVKTPLLTKTTRNEGVEQASYGDWPLYYYAGDTTPGDVNGQNVDNEWFVVTPDGKLRKP